MLNLLLVVGVGGNSKGSARKNFVTFEHNFGSTRNKCHLFCHQVFT
jgi:hypothetical protein